MPASITCPHCCQPIPVRDESSGREFPCPLCGKPLTAPPSTATAEPSPSEAFAFDEPGEMPAPPRSVSRTSTDTYELVAELLPEWQSAWHGLNLAGLAAKLFILAYVLRIISKSILPLKSAEGIYFPLLIIVLSLSIAHLLIMLVHLWGQFMCRRLPESYGTWTGRRSCYLGIAAALLIGSIFTAMVINTFLSDFVRSMMVILLGVLFLFVAPVLILGWFWYWIGFLRKLGTGLNSYELVGGSRSFMGWLWLTFWANLILMFIVSSSKGSMPILASSCLELFVGILTTLMLINYNRLLRTARDVLARRGPAST